MFSIPLIISYVVVSIISIVLYSLLTYMADSMYDLHHILAGDQVDAATAILTDARRIEDRQTWQLARDHVDSLHQWYSSDYLLQVWQPPPALRLKR